MGEVVRGVEEEEVWEKEWGGGKERMESGVEDLVELGKEEGGGVEKKFREKMEKMEGVMKWMEG